MIDASYDLDNLFNTLDEYDNKIGFVRVSTLGKKNPTYLESVQPYDYF